MKTKFEQGEKVLLGDVEHEIVVAQKNFSSGKISYKLSNGQKVAESDLKRASKRTTKNDPLAKLRDEYTELYGKKPSNAKKNDAEWLQAKIDEKKPTETPWDVLTSLDEEATAEFIKTKELEIDPEDYDGLEALHVAISQELEIEIPE